MSSHHIVKEKQEPALYIHHLGNFNEELLGQLLEWSPTVIVQESAYEKITSMGIKVDLVAGGIGLQDDQEHTAHIPNANDLTAVIDYLEEKGYPALNIISEGRGTVILKANADKLNLVWLNEHEKTFVVKSGFTVWKPAGTIYFFDKTADMGMTNLQAINEGSYEVIADGFVSFTFNAPYLALTEQL